MKRMTRVIFIAGCWRSGSTLLGDLLGSIPGLAHVGELHHVWRRGLQLDWLCGCGAPFNSCAYWKQVIEGLGPGLDLARMQRLDEMRRTLPRSAGEGPAALKQASPEYVSMTGKLARAAARAGDGVLVDSSKRPLQAHVLMAAGFDVSVIHLVRDPRATIYSLVNRAKVRRDDPQGSRMIQMDLESAGKLWVRSNLQSEQLQRHADRFVTVRYEDFVKAPVESARELARFALGRDGEPELDAVGKAHTLSGNPGRMLEGKRLEVRLDEEWRTGLAAETRAYIERKTKPLMERYGYT